jgi:hypothetical protein
MRAHFVICDRCGKQERTEVACKDPILRVLDWASVWPASVHPIGLAPRWHKSGGPPDVCASCLSSDEQEQLEQNALRDSDYGRPW